MIDRRVSATLALFPLVSFLAFLHWSRGPLRRAYAGRASSETAALRRARIAKWISQRKLIARSEGERAIMILRERLRKVSSAKRFRLTRRFHRFRGKSVE